MGLAAVGLAMAGLVACTSDSTDSDPATGEDAGEADVEVSGEADAESTADADEPLDILQPNDGSGSKDGSDTEPSEPDSEEDTLEPEDTRQDDDSRTGDPDSDDAIDPDAAGDTEDSTERPDAIEPPEPEPPTSVGTEFWFGFMENLDLAFNGPPSFAVQVAAEVATSGQIEVPKTGFAQVFQVGAGEAIEITLPDGILYPEISEQVSDLGFRVTTAQPVTIRAIHYRPYFTEISSIVPVGELSDRYVVIAQPDLAEQGPSAMLIMATEDDTSVEFKPSAVTTKFKSPGSTFGVDLDAGQTYQIQAFGDLSGTVVQAIDGKKIAVFGGARQANVACIGADSHLWEQVLPTSRWGTEYVIVPFKNNNGAAPVRVVADDEKTPVEFSCRTPQVVDPGPGIEINLGTPTVIRATNPVGVGQLVKSAQCGGIGDPNLLIYPPATLTTKNARWATVTGEVESLKLASHYVNVVVNSSVTSLELDGESLLSDLTPIPGHPSLLYLQAQVPTGEHHLTADVGFQAVAYGLGDYDAYAFFLGYTADEAGIGLSGTEPSESCPDIDFETVDAITTTTVGSPDLGPGTPGECLTGCDCIELFGEPFDIECSEDTPIWICDNFFGTCEKTCGLLCESCDVFGPCP